MILDKLSDSIYVLNLKERTDKLSHIKSELARIGCHTYKVVEAINGKDYQNTTRLKDGNLGLLLTYYKIYREWSVQNSESIMLIEDDCVFDENFGELAETFLQNLPEDWDMVYFGGNHNRHESKSTTTTVNPFCIKLSHTFTTHCVLLKRHVFEELITRLASYEYEVDVALAILQKTYNAYCPHKTLATQVPGVSDIENKFVNYDAFIRD